MAATRADVARLAGTSPALVSYVINGGPRNVAPSTTARILEAIETLGYRPNSVARSLRMSRGHSLGLIVPDSSNPFFASLAQAVEEAAYSNGYPLLVGNAADTDEREIGYVRAFVDRQVEGLLVIPTSESAALTAEYERTQIPLVVIDRQLDENLFLTVRSDAVTGARSGVEHLISHGHTEIACLSGPDIGTSHDRVRGYHDALSAAGLTPRPLVQRPFGGRAGYDALPELLDGDTAPTAIFVTSDLAAMGLLRALYDSGKRVPDDVAVVSFDGIEYAGYTTPGLTTVEQPVAEIGLLAIELLMASISGKRVTGAHSLPTTLRRRGSCGCPEAFLV